MKERLLTELGNGMLRNNNLNEERNVYIKIKNKI